MCSTDMTVDGVDSSIVFGAIVEVIDGVKTSLISAEFPGLLGTYPSGASTRLPVFTESDSCSLSLCKLNPSTSFDREFGLVVLVVS